MKKLHPILLLLFAYFFNKAVVVVTGLESHMFVCRVCLIVFVFINQEIFIYLFVFKITVLTGRLHKKIIN